MGFPGRVPDTTWSRRRVVRDGLGLAAAGAAALFLPRSRGVSAQATPVPADGALTADAIARAVAALPGIVEDAMARTGVPGLAVSVVFGDAPVFEGGFGVREAGKPEPVTPETVFQLASMSKPISGTLVAAAVGDGAAAWDDPCVGLDPSFAMHDPYVTANCTPRDCFAHRTGLAEHAGDELWDLGFDREECMARLREIPLAHPFRAAYAYSNIGLSAGAYAVAAAAAPGASWEEWLAERLFAPLGMDATSARFADWLAADNRAVPHYKIGDGPWTPGPGDDDAAFAPAGAVSSTARDLARWMRLQLGRGTFEGAEIVAAAPLLETWRPQILVGSMPDPADGRFAFAGLGWNIGRTDGGRITLSHGGDFATGAHTLVGLLPGAGLGLTVLTNAQPTGVREAVWQTFLDVAETGAPGTDWLAEYAPAYAGGVAALLDTGYDLSSPPANPAPPLPPEAYAGVYDNPLLGEMTVSPGGNGGLTATIGPAPTTLELRHWDRDAFVAPIGEAWAGDAVRPVVFTVGPDGVAQSVTLGRISANGQGTFVRREG